jgi:hypothetical protein
VSAAWVAATTRGRGLARRRLGRDGALRLARLEGLEPALAELAQTPYGHDVRRGMDLPAARHAVSAAALWNLRVLAGWGPALGAGRVYALVAGFEAANISGHLAAIDGRVPSPPFELGSMAGVWPVVARARVPAEVRRVLASSPWGDPGTEDFAGVRLALRLAWARRVAAAVPEAALWAGASTALAMARALAVGAAPAPGTPAARDATRLLGSRWATARSPGDLVDALPHSVRWALSGVDPGSWAEADLWQAEARWWVRVESDAAALAVPPRPDPSVVVGVAGLLGADAWRIRAALELAARGGGPLAEVLDAVA